MRQDSALVGILVECGYSRIRSSKIASIVDQVHLEGMRSDDLAAALLHWRSRYARQAYANGTQEAYQVFADPDGSRSGPGEYTLPLFDLPPTPAVECLPHSPAAPTPS